MNRVDRFIVNCPSFEEFRKRMSALPVTKDRGDAFERLTQAYLQTAPEYRTALVKVWLLREVPASVRAEIGLPRAHPGPRRVRNRDRGKARRPIHDPEQDTGGEAAPGGRLVKA